MVVAKTATVKTEPKPKPKPASPSWNGERRALFLDTLALTPNVAASERAAGMPAGSAYKERRRSREFADAWDDALADGYSQLELLMLERALTGIAKRTTKRGETTIVTDFSDRLGMALLAAHRATVAARRGHTATVDAETAKDRLARRIDDMRRRLDDA
jgi:hypothetical protein